MLTGLIVLIFEFILRAKKDWCSTICLALASHRLYAILKSCFPEPIRLDLILSTYDLGRLRFENWLGPKYRLAYIEQDSAWRDPIFLHKDVYGKDESGNKDLMTKRFLYRELWYLEGICIPNVRRTKVHILPCPTGLGDSWYKQAVEAIERTDRKMVEDVANGYWLEMEGYKNKALREAKQHIEGRFMSFARMKAFVMLCQAR